MKWKTASGEVLEVRDMTDSHLANAVAYLERRIAEFEARLATLRPKIAKQRRSKKYNNTFCGWTGPDAVVVYSGDVGEVSVSQAQYDATNVERWLSGAREKLVGLRTEVERRARESAVCP